MAPGGATASRSAAVTTLSCCSCLNAIQPPLLWPAAMMVDQSGGTLVSGGSCAFTHCSTRGRESACTSRLQAGVALYLRYPARCMLLQAGSDKIYRDTGRDARRCEGNVSQFAMYPLGQPTILATHHKMHAQAVVKLLMVHKDEHSLKTPTRCKFIRKRTSASKSVRLSAGRLYCTTKKPNDARRVAYG